MVFSAGQPRPTSLEAYRGLRRAVWLQPWSIGDIPGTLEEGLATGVRTIRDASVHAVVHRSSRSRGVWITLLESSRCRGCAGAKRAVQPSTVQYSRFKFARWGLFAGSGIRFAFSRADYLLTYLYTNQKAQTTWDYYTLMHSVFSVEYSRV